jgi:hypothetical protein
MIVGIKKQPGFLQTAKISTSASLILYPKGAKPFFCIVMSLIYLVNI